MMNISYCKMEERYNGIKRTHKVLMAEALAFILLSVLVAIVFESNLLVPGMLTVNAEVMYNVMMFMELVTICAIPVALKMFSIKFIRRRLSAEGSTALLKWGMLRILLIGLPMLVNTISYYLFMSVAFAYMAGIGLLCFSFIYPSKDRCMDETKQSDK